MRIVQALTLLTLAWTAGAVRGQDLAPMPASPISGERAGPANPAGPGPWEMEQSCAGGPFWAEAEYLVYWLKPVCLTVPTLSVGSPSDPQPGVLGQPHTQLAQGSHKFEFDGASGIRPRVGAWLTDDQFLGVEAEGFVLEQVANGQPVATATGSPSTYLVFQNPDNTKGALPFTLPGVVTGSSAAVGTTQMWGLEGNLTTRLAREYDGWTLHAAGLFGCRYLQLDDRVVVTNRQALVASPAVAAVGQADFATRNQFVGGQIGSRVGVEHGPLDLSLTMKLAFGEVHLVSDVYGGPLVSGTSVLPPLVPGPLLALPSNVGRQESDRVAIVPEFNLRLRWRVNDHVGLVLGYDLLYWNRILCPGDQMDPLVNTTQLPFRGPVAGPAQPAPRFVFTDAFAQGLEAGVEYRF